MLGQEAEYGIGVMKRPSRAGQMLGHDGVFPGYHSTMGWFPESGMAAAFQINTDDMRSARRPLNSVIAEFVRIAREELAQS